MRYLLIIILCLIPIIGNTTETIKISELGTAASGDATDDDYFVMVDDPGGAPVTKKITGQNLFGALPRLGVTSCGTGVVYSTADVFSCETTLATITLSGGTASTVAVWDASQNLTALTTQNMNTTGNISGKVPIINKADNYTLGTDSAQEAYGYMVFMTGDGKILTLPAVVIGMSVCVYSVDATAKVVDPNANDGIRNGTAARNADGHTITSDASAGAFVCLIADSADGWTTLGKSGTWTDE